MNDIKLLKMPFRENVICKVVDETPETITIKNPMVLVVLGNQNSGSNQQPNIGVAPWLEFTDEDVVTLDKTHILCILDPVHELKNEYNANFGSGLITPDSKLIVPGQ